MAKDDVKQQVNDLLKQVRGTRPQGFAAMTEDAQRRAASKGGQRAHELGRAHEYSAEEAAAAGRIGGKIVSQDREHMAEIGRKGAEAKKAARAQQIFERRSAAHKKKQVNGEAEE